MTEVEIIVMGKTFTKFKIPKADEGKLITIIENFLGEPNWHKW